MSGGSMDYAYQSVRNAADLLERSIQNYGDHDGLRRNLSLHLDKAAEILRTIEWCDSADKLPNEWIEPTREFLKRTL